MPERSIHYRRRWFYALWSALLLLSCIALGLWEHPVRRDLASMQLHLRVAGAPEGTRAQAWAGPRAAWKGKEWSGEGAFGDGVLAPDGRAMLPLVRLAIARRRWNLGYIPRGTWDLVMVKLSPRAGLPRYVMLPCSEDIATALLRPGYKLSIDIEVSWKNLGVDANPINRVP